MGWTAGRFMITQGASVTIEFTGRVNTKARNLLKLAHC